MKRIFAFALCIFAIACTESTPEAKIEKEFKIYINENFDNPNDLMDIISISHKQTFSKDYVAETMALIIEGEKILENIQKEDSRCWKIFGDANLKFNGDYKALKLMMNSLNAFDEISEWVKKNSKRKEDLEKEIAESYALLDSTITVTAYEIKTRVNHSDGPKITYFYSLYSDKVISITDNYECPEEFKDITSKCVEQLSMINEYAELYQAKLDATHDFLDYLKLPY